MLILILIILLIIFGGGDCYHMGVSLFRNVACRIGDFLSLTGFCNASLYAIYLSLTDAAQVLLAIVYCALGSEQFRANGVELESIGFDRKQEV
jgi:hypothetical protein